jgi:hypothetical protein
VISHSNDGDDRRLHRPRRGELRGGEAAEELGRDEKESRVGKENRGPKALKVPKGKKGAGGPAGATKVVVRYAETTTQNGEAGYAEAVCKPGEVATGGGAEMYNGNSAGVDWFQPGGVPYPSSFFTPGEEPVPIAWYAHWFNESGSTDTFRVFVDCASP